MSKVDRVNIFRQFRLDKITSILETRDGGSEIWLDTAARGSRSFKVSLSIDEIEDILKAEDERRNPYRSQA
jgi:hypothetical protein